MQIIYSQSIRKNVDFRHDESSLNFSRLLLSRMLGREARLSPEPSREEETAEIQATMRGASWLVGEYGQYSTYLGKLCGGVQRAF